MEARDGASTFGFGEVSSRPKEKCLLCEIHCLGQTRRTMLSYKDLLPLPGGHEALGTHFLRQIVEPKWWERLFRVRKS
jgi:hypothetical protein